MSNYQQPNTGNPTPNAAVTVQVEGHNNPMGLTFPLAKYTQPISTKDAPNGYATPSGK